LHERKNANEKPKHDVSVFYRIAFGHYIKRRVGICEELGNNRNKNAVSNEVNKDRKEDDRQWIFFNKIFHFNIYCAPSALCHLFASIKTIIIADAVIDIMGIVMYPNSTINL